MNGAARLAVVALALGATYAVAKSRAQAEGYGAVDVPEGDDAEQPDVAGEALAPFQHLSDAIEATVNEQQTTSDEGIAALQQREAFSPVPYVDAGGHSIGYGHFILPGESFDRITEEEGAALLAKDLGPREAAVRANVHVPLTQNQFDALVSFVYNVGAGNFRSSTLLKLLNAGDYDGAAAEFAKWNKSQGKVLPALVARRADEQQQFMG